MPKELENDFFIFDCEAQIMPKELRQHVFYYPETAYFAEPDKSVTSRWWWTNPVTKEQPFGRKPADWTAEALIAAMDAAGVDKACVFREDYSNMTDYLMPLATNAQVIEAARKYADRIIPVSQVGPHLHRGVDVALRELAVLHRDHGFVATKVFSPIDGDLNDQRMWPFWERCCELDIVVFVHLGFSLGSARTKHCLPIQLDDVCCTFPDLKVVGYHMGYPYYEETIMLALKHKNLHLSPSGILAWLYYAPERLRHLIGLATSLISSDKLIFGTDWAGAPMEPCVKAILDLEIGPEMQSEWGYPPFTREDKANVLGLNLARLLKVVPERSKSKLELSSR
jgi:predicted TIM-barrel fold metal-dependent hydrolase